MAIGYFIREGDKTTCGGIVIDSDTRVMMFGIAHSREYDRVTCGKDGKIYQIIGGVSYIESHGRLVAGTLDSVSSCPCRAQLIPSFFESRYENEDSPATQASKIAAQANGGFTKKPQVDSASNYATTPSSAFTDVVCDERFQFINHQYLPCGISDYALLQNDQCIADGKLDAQGQSRTYNSVDPASLQLAISAPLPIME